ncbi:MAG: hypothetical protein KCHDKBKB_00926 [Elusimicrobia bacterium]|nr:hypothetical protein [Elusimicrobiota bacterium]
MKTARAQKRSVSPFGLSAPLIEDPFAQLKDILSKDYSAAPAEKKPQLRSLDDICFLPYFIEKIAQAPANDAPDLDALCQFLLRFKETMVEKGLAVPLYESMRELFRKKTDLFMIDHLDHAHCERVGISADHQDVVLFSKERDALVGRYFAPFTETQPGLFSEFVTEWTDTENPDRLLHFLDFSAGSKKPTFEHYLLFAHPALARVVSNKPQLRSMFEKARGLLSKLSSPTWEKDTRHALGV